MPARSADAGWKSRLRREIGWLLLAKLCALVLLWALFFSPWKRPAADAPTVATRMALPTSVDPEDVP